MAETARAHRSRALALKHTFKSAHALIIPRYFYTNGTETIRSHFARLLIPSKKSIPYEKRPEPKKIPEVSNCK